MTRLTLRSLASRKLRTALTAMAIVLGVAMISGTYVLTDTIDRAFGDIFQQAAEGVDVSVTPREAIEGSPTPARSARRRLLDRVRACPRAERRGDIFGRVTLLGGDEPRRPAACPRSRLGGARPLRAFNAAEGRLPRRRRDPRRQGHRRGRGLPRRPAIRVLGDRACRPPPRRIAGTGRSTRSRARPSWS
jgi:putative ABC transport system permease protein